MKFFPDKLLYEIIEPVDQRMDGVKKFLLDVDPSLTYDILPIYDPFGPSVTDEKLEAIIVSQDTLKGAQRVNEQRVKNVRHHSVIHKI